MMNNNPFAIRKSPVAVIAAQAVALDDYVLRSDDLAGIPRGGKLGVRVKSVLEANGGGEGAPIKTCKTLS